MPLTQRPEISSAIVRPPPLSRAWHIDLAHGGGETIVAHECHVLTGVLAFFNHPAPDDSNGDGVLIRAFGPRQWTEVALIDTPYATAVHLPPPDHLSDARR